ncbi:uncharacterized protein PpBr36_10413 [Pyricularia pennisetigena]|uniref:uncharacterized protein n=1 Tax=Pyricularia pennisetigena TaxID=1578925 RepID=UPI00114EC9CC|nr:uncharacterized protein PpBr36_10413 [Pyricularia pennisetigena]TLS21454.1 hypothetical protein PpBr36_10413 [Pyricularia pennisetigena]
MFAFLTAQSGEKQLADFSSGDVGDQVCSRVFCCARKCGISHDSLPSVAELTVLEFIKKVMFRKFNAPENGPRPLTYNKGCRLIDVDITQHGVKTRGHLWKLGRVVDTADFPPELPWIEKAKGNLNLHERKALLQLAIFLEDTDDFLAHQIYDYLDYDAASVGKRWVTFTEKHLYDMAAELAAGILARRELMLGKLWNSPWHSFYRAVFVLQEMECNGPSPPPSFAFTSVMQGQIGSQHHDANDLDYNASLAVDIQGSAGGEPRLRVQN